MSSSDGGSHVLRPPAGFVDPAVHSTADVVDRRDLSLADISLMRLSGCRTRVPASQGRSSSGLHPIPGAATNSAGWRSPGSPVSSNIPAASTASPLATSAAAHAVAGRDVHSPGTTAADASFSIAASSSTPPRCTGVTRIHKRCASPTTLLGTSLLMLERMAQDTAASTLALAAAGGSGSRAGSRGALGTSGEPSLHPSPASGGGGSALSQGLWPTSPPTAGGAPEPLSPPWVLARGAAASEPLCRADGSLARPQPVATTGFVRAAGQDRGSPTAGRACAVPDDGGAAHPAREEGGRGVDGGPSGGRRDSMADSSYSSCRKTTSSSGGSRRVVPAALSISELMMDRRTTPDAPPPPPPQPQPQTRAGTYAKPPLQPSTLRERAGSTPQPPPPRRGSDDHGLERSTHDFHRILSLEEKEALTISVQPYEEVDEDAEVVPLDWTARRRRAGQAPEAAASSLDRATSTPGPVSAASRVCRSRSGPGRTGDARGRSTGNGYLYRGRAASPTSVDSRGDGSDLVSSPGGDLDVLSGLPGSRPASGGAVEAVGGTSPTMLHPFQTWRFPLLGRCDSPLSSLRDATGHAGVRRDSETSSTAAWQHAGGAAAASSGYDEESTVRPPTTAVPVRVPTAGGPLSAFTAVGRRYDHSASYSNPLRTARGSSPEGGSDPTSTSPASTSIPCRARRPPPHGSRAEGASVDSVGGGRRVGVSGGSPSPWSDGGGGEGSGAGPSPPALPGRSGGGGAGVAPSGMSHRSGPAAARGEPYYQTISAILSAGGGPHGPGAPFLQVFDMVYAAYARSVIAREQEAMGSSGATALSRASSSLAVSMNALAGRRTSACVMNGSDMGEPHGAGARVSGGWHGTGHGAAVGVGAGTLGGGYAAGPHVEPSSATTPAMSLSAAPGRSAGYYSFGNRLSLQHPNRQSIPSTHELPSFSYLNCAPRGGTGVASTRSPTRELSAPIATTTATAAVASPSSEGLCSRRRHYDPAIVARISRRPLLQTTVFLHYSLAHMRMAAEARQARAAGRTRSASPSSHTAAPSAGVTDPTWTHSPSASPQSAEALPLQTARPPPAAVAGAAAAAVVSGCTSGTGSRPQRARLENDSEHAQAGCRRGSGVSSGNGGAHADPMYDDTRVSATKVTSPGRVRSPAGSLLHVSRSTTSTQRSPQQPLSSPHSNTRLGGTGSLTMTASASASCSTMPAAVAEVARPGELHRGSGQSHPRPPNVLNHRTGHLVECNDTSAYSSGGGENEESDPAGSRGWQAGGPPSHSVTAPAAPSLGRAVTEVEERASAGSEGVGGRGSCSDLAVAAKRAGPAPFLYASHRGGCNEEEEDEGGAAAAYDGRGTLDKSDGEEEAAAAAAAGATSSQPPAVPPPQLRYRRTLTPYTTLVRHTHTIDGFEREVDNEAGDLVVYAGMRLMGWLEVVDLLGRGSFGQVFLCKDLRISDGHFVHPSEIEADDYAYWNCCHAYLPFSDCDVVPTHAPLVAVKVVKSEPLLEQQSVLEAEMLVLLGAQTAPGAAGTTPWPVSAQASPADGAALGSLQPSAMSGPLDPPPPDPRCTYIAKVLADGTCYGHHCIVMERYGANLCEMMESNGYKGLPLYQIRSIARQLLLGLTLTHGCHIIHADVKPENVMLTLDSCCSAVSTNALAALPASPAQAAEGAHKGAAAEVSLSRSHREGRGGGVEGRSGASDDEAAGGAVCGGGAGGEPAESAAARSVLLHGPSTNAGGSGAPQPTVTLQAGQSHRQLPPGRSCQSLSECVGAGPETVVAVPEPQRVHALNQSSISHLSQHLSSVHGGGGGAVSGVDPAGGLSGAVATPSASAIPPRPAPSLHIKLIDFSASCYDRGPFYTYIQSRYYRAPEVIVNAEYDSGIDLWSTGCVLAELLLGLPLLPGCNDHHQLCLMEDMFGPLPPSLLDRGAVTGAYYDVIRGGRQSVGDGAGAAAHPGEPQAAAGMGGEDAGGVGGGARHTLISREEFFTRNGLQPMEYRRYFNCRTLTELVRRCVFSVEERRMSNGEPPYPSRAGRSATDSRGASCAASPCVESALTDASAVAKQHKAQLIATTRAELMKQRFLLCDLLTKLLSMDPRRRPTAAEALTHPFFTDQPTYMLHYGLE